LDERHGGGSHQGEIQGWILSGARPQAPESAGLLAAIPEADRVGSQPQKTEDLAPNLLPENQKKAEAEGGVILFEDESIFQQSGTTCKTYAKRGEGTFVKHKPCRKSCKVFGAVSIGANPKFHFRFEKNRFNTGTYLKFLKRLIRYYSRRGKKIHLIADNVRFHKAKSLLDWIEDRRDQIELHFLPPYSPNLNPVEMIWQKTKRAATHNRFFNTLEDLRERLFRRFNRFQGNPASLRNMVLSWT